MILVPFGESYEGSYIAGCCRVCGHNGTIIQYREGTHWWRVWCSWCNAGDWRYTNDQLRQLP